VTADKEALPKISHSDQETKLPTPLADHCVLAESNGLGAFFGVCSDAHTVSGPSDEDE